MKRGNCSRVSILKSAFTDSDQSDWNKQGKGKRRVRESSPKTPPHSVNRPDIETTLSTAFLLARLDTPSADPTTSESGWREDDFLQASLPPILFRRYLGVQQFTRIFTRWHFQALRQRLCGAEVRKTLLTAERECLEIVAESALRNLCKPTKPFLTSNSGLIRVSASAPVGCPRGHPRSCSPHLPGTY
jgi:hypothetical protein